MQHRFISEDGYKVTCQYLVPMQLHKQDRPFPQVKLTPQLGAIFDDPDQTPKPAEMNSLINKR